MATESTHRYFNLCVVRFNGTPCSTQVYTNDPEQAAKRLRELYERTKLEDGRLPLGLFMFDTLEQIGTLAILPEALPKLG